MCIQKKNKEIRNLKLFQTPDFSLKELSEEEIIKRLKEDPMFAFQFEEIMKRLTESYMDIFSKSPQKQNIEFKGIQRSNKEREDDTPKLNICLCFVVG